MNVSRPRNASPRTHRRGAAGAVAVLAGVLAAIGFGSTASAHVDVDVDGGAVAGRPAEVVFEVPNERDDASTVTIIVQMPQDVGLTDVVPSDVDGWTVSTTTSGDVVETVRWDADGPGLAGDESASLPVSVGPLPAVAELAFPTVQIYDSGEVVRWIEPQVPGGPEPELPVPTLAVAPPAATTAPTEPSATAAPSTPAPTEPPTTRPATVPATEPTTPPTEPPPTPTDPPDDDDGGSAAWPWVLAGVAVVVLVGGAAAIARRRSSP